MIYLRLSLSIKSDKDRMGVMKPMADPMTALLSYQKDIEGRSIDPQVLKDDYLQLFDETPGGRKRYINVKIVGTEVQALSIFVLDDPINSIATYNVGYAVSEIHRKRGLAVEVVNKGFDRLRKELSLTNLERFYVEAIVEVTNIASLKTARKLFSGPGRPMIDFESGRQALHFLKLFNLL